MPRNLVAIARWLAEGKTIEEMRQLMVRSKTKRLMTPKQVWGEVQKLATLVETMTRAGAKWPVRLPKEGYEWKR